MASKVQICNMALSRLAASTITSLTDNTTEAKLCNTLFDDLSERVMAQGSWSTCIKRAELAATTTTPTFEYTNEYQLPVDPKCLKVLNVNEDIPGSTTYRIEGDKLLTDESTIKIRYVAFIANTDDWGPLLTESVEVLLASYLANPITGDKQIADRLRQEYGALLSNNMAIDNQQGSKEEIWSDGLIEVR